MSIVSCGSGYGRALLGLNTLFGIYLRVSTDVPLDLAEAKLVAPPIHPGTVAT
jgi:hypothetical protein